MRNTGCIGTVTISRPNCYRQPRSGSVPPGPSRHPAQPAEKNSPQSVKQQMRCIYEDEGSSLIIRHARHYAAAHVRWTSWRWATSTTVTTRAFRRSGR